MRHAVLPRGKEAPGEVRGAAKVGYQNDNAVMSSPKCLLRVQVVIEYNIRSALDQNGKWNR